MISLGYDLTITTPLTNNGVVIGKGANAIAAITPLNDDEVLVGNTGNAPSGKTLETILQAHPDVSVDTVALLKAYQGPATGVLVTQDGRGGVFSWRTGNQKTNCDIDPGEGVWVKPDGEDGTNGAWERQFTGRAMASWFGPWGSGVDATATLKAFFETTSAFNLAGRIPDGARWESDGQIISGLVNLNIVCDGTVYARNGAAETVDLIRLVGTGSLIWKGGTFNCNDSPLCAMLVMGFAYTNIDIDEGYGITAVDGVSSGSTSVVSIINVPKSVTRVRYAHNLVGTAAPLLGSVPRIVSAGASDSTVMNVDIEINLADAPLHSAIVLGDLNGGVANIRNGTIQGAFDNGAVYNVGDASDVNIFNWVAIDTDEISVCSGSGRLTHYNLFGRGATNSIGLQNCEAVSLVNADLAFNDGVDIVKTRANNIAAGKFSIRNSLITCTPASRVCDFGTNGTLEEYEDINNVWRVIYKEGVTTGGGGTCTIWTMAAGPRCRIQSDSDWVLEDSVTTQVVSGAADNGSGEIRLTVNDTSSLTTGDSRWVSGVLGTTEANAEWTITVVDGTHIDLDGSTFANAYTGGGNVGSVPNNTTFLISLPNVTEQSYWYGQLINRTGNNTVLLRLANSYQQLLDLRDVYIVSNIQSANEPNRGDLQSIPPRRFIRSNAAATTGYHPAGQYIENVDYTGTIAGWRAKVAGSPPTFYEVGYAPRIISGTTTANIEGAGATNISAGANGVAFTVAVTGALTSDAVIDAQLVASQTRIKLHAWVSSSNTVTVVPQNVSDGTYTRLAGATVNVRVMKTNAM